MSNKKIYIILFAILYICVALVSTIHAISFFGLANVKPLAIILAVAFEIGQAAVLFSILTDKNQQKKIMPWVLMGILTLVQVMGNVYNSYQYLILNSEASLRFFKEPIFIWTQIEDANANVILSYIIGAILPIVSLLLTSMVTGFLNRDEDKKEEIKYIEDKGEEVGDIKEDEPSEEALKKFEEIKKEREKKSQLIPDNEEIEPEELPYNDIEEKQEEYVETLPEEIKEETEIPVEEIIEQLPKNEDGEIIGTDMHDDGSLNGEPGEPGIEEVNEKVFEPVTEEVKEKPKSHFINI